MLRQNLNDLLAFVAVAREESFTMAAAQLGVTQSALSHTVKGLEERLGLRLLTRTTRSVRPTETGERLLASIGPYFTGIEQELVALNNLRDKPAGTIRISADEHSAKSILWPKLSPLMLEYPDINIEIDIEFGFSDIVAERFDAGVRIGQQLGNSMIAVRIAPDMRMIVVGAPSYLAQRSAPEAPQDLENHQCINLRLSTHGGLYSWEFARDGQPLTVRVKGQATFNTTLQILSAALDGFGLAFLPEDLVGPHIEEGALVPLMLDWCPSFAGYHLYYPNRMLSSPVLSLVVEALRYPSKGQRSATV